MNLLKQQKNFESKLNINFIEKSVHDTCKKLLELNEIKQAEKFKADFKIPDRR